MTAQLWLYEAIEITFLNSSGLATGVEDPPSEEEPPVSVVVCSPQELHIQKKGKSMMVASMAFIVILL